MLQDETLTQAEDASQGAEDTSRQDKGTTSGEEATISKKAAEKMVSDAKAEAGRVQKAQAEQITLLTQEKESLTSRVNQSEQDMASLRQEIKSIKLEGAKDNPELLKKLQDDLAAEEKLNAALKKERDVAAREEEIKKKELKLETDSYENLVNKLAAEHGVKADELKKFGVTNPEHLTEIAKALGKKKPAGGGEEHKGEEEEEGNPDSLTGTGSLNMSVEQLDKDDMATYAAKRKKQDPSLI